MQWPPARPGDGPDVPQIPGLEDLHPIGKGGNAVVYQARQTSPARLVAVKVFTSTILDDRARRQFGNENTRLGEAGSKAGVVTVHFGGLTHDGFPYLVMELCDGSLQQHLGSLSARRVAEIGSVIATALGALHAHGVIHGDVTPANILFAHGGKPVLSDFGLSAVAADSGGRQDSATWEHASPETWRNASGPKSDVHGLGSTLFAALTGAPPVPRALGEPLESYAARVMSTRIVPLAVPGADPDLLKVLDRMLAAKPEQRIGAMEAATALAECAGTPQSAPPAQSASSRQLDNSAPQTNLRPEARPGTWQAVPAASAVPGAAETLLRDPTATAAAGSPKKADRTARWLIAGGVALVAVIASAVVYFLTSANHAPAAGTPTTPPPPPELKIKLAPPVDNGTAVDLSWTGPPGFEYAVIIAEEGASGEPKTKIVLGATRFTVEVAPDRKYCFQIQGSADGKTGYSSQLRQIRDAKCVERVEPSSASPAP